MIKVSGRKPTNKVSHQPSGSLPFLTTMATNTLPATQQSQPFAGNKLHYVKIGHMWLKDMNDGGIARTWTDGPLTISLTSETLTIMPLWSYFWYESLLHSKIWVV